MVYHILEPIKQSLLTEIWSETQTVNMPRNRCLKLEEVGSGHEDRLTRYRVILVCAVDGVLCNGIWE